MTDEKPEHYYLVAAEVVYSINAEKPEDEQLNSVRLNGVVHNKRQEFPAVMIARSQQVAQMHFFNRMAENGSKVTVRDVVLLNVTYLGKFTQESFAALPADLQPKTTSPTANNPFADETPTVQ